MAADPSISLDMVHAAIRDGTLAAASEVHPRSIHAPTAMYRLFHNSRMPTPAKFVNDSVAARKMSSKGKFMLQKARLALKLNPVTKAKMELDGRRLQQRSHDLRSIANTENVGYASRRRAQLTHACMQARRIDPHHLASLVLGELTLVDPLNSEPACTIPQAEGLPPPPVLFHNHFRDLNRELRLSMCSAATKHRRFWRARIPQAPHDPSLTESVTPNLIYWLIFPSTKKCLPERCQLGACAVCDRTEEAWHAWRPDDPHSVVEPPSFKPNLRASRAPGPDGLKCEDWRWARPEELDKRYDYRIELATHLAAYVNRILSEGRVPDSGFAECTSFPIFKEGKPGQPKPDRALPNNYRDITVGNLLAKLVSLVLTFRLSHWAIRHNMISPEQVAFMPYHSAESHVFSFSQLLRSKAREGKSTRALFIDLNKAYNRVHLASLWHLLREMGVPELIVNLLDDWAVKRRTRILVNGVLSEEYSMLAGTPQGDPLSCLLFNLWIEPLIRHINSVASIRGITIPGMNRVIKSLFFADDIVGPSELELDCSQEIMDAVMRWCLDWLMEINTSAGKTETVTYFAEPSHAHDAVIAIVYARAPPDIDLDNDDGLLPVLPVYGPWKVLEAAALELIVNPLPVATSITDLNCTPIAVPITESDGYRYLGWRSKADISDTLATVNLIKTMDMLYYRYFTFNLTIRRCSPTLQLQLLHCHVIGPIVYLLSMLSVSSELKNKFDRRMRRYGRHIFGLSRNTPRSIVIAITRINPFRALQGRERARLCLQLASPLLPNLSIAHAIYKSLLPRLPGKRTAHANLPSQHSKELVAMKSRGIIIPEPKPVHYLTTISAGLHGDSIALQQWRHESRVASAIPDPPHVNRPRRISGAPQILMTLRLPRPLPLEHAADIYFNFSQSALLAPEKHGLVSLSYVGPGGTSIVALSNLRSAIVSIVARLQTGNIALGRHPWRSRTLFRQAPHTGSGIPGADDEVSDTDTESDASTSDDEIPDPDVASTASEWSSSSDSDSDSVDIPRRKPRRAGARPSNSGSCGSPTTPWPTAASLCCRFCKRGHEHPAHIFLECLAGNLSVLRQELLVDAQVQWRRIISKIEDATYSEYADSVNGTAEARAAITSAYSSHDLTEAMWLTHRLLWAIPWPACAVPANATAACALGKIFDSTTLSRHACRSLADSWVMWSAKWCNRFGVAWTTLVKSLQTSNNAGHIDVDDSDF